MRARAWALGLMSVVAMAAPAEAVSLHAYQQADVREAIARITRGAVQARLADRPYHPGAVPALLRAPGAVFVTFSRNGVTRGCWGGVSPRSPRLADELAETAAKALTLDRRHPAIRFGAMDGLVAHVSIVGDLEPVADAGNLMPRRHGLLVAGPGKGGVLLPGEAATAAWQVATCRRKAGLRPRERARMYRFETTVIGPITLSP